MFDTFFACAPGIEDLLQAELRGLGFRPKSVAGGADLQLTGNELARAAYGVGVASHVRVRLGRGPGQSLLSWAPKLEWARVATGTPQVRSAGVGEDLIERLQAKLPKTDQDASYTVLARRDGDDIELSVDAAGAPLHQRGYRRATGKAPLRPDLARAFLRLSGWRPQQSLTDPFCGSGTLLAEALLLAAKVPPAFLRSLLCLQWPEVDAAPPVPRSHEEPPQIFGFDRDAGVVQGARDNLARITDALGWPLPVIEYAALKAQPWQTGGYVVSNPPHGGRVGKASTLRNLYQSLGHQVRTHDKKLALWVSDRKLAYATGVRMKSALFTRQSGRKAWVMVQP